MAQSAIFLFAPKFCEFGVDVAKEWMRLQGETDQSKVHGLCTGPKKIKKRVETGLGGICGEMAHLPSLERSWLDERPSENELSNFNQLYAPGTLGKTITADRRVGLGYVRNGRTRPDLIADRAIDCPEYIPETYAVRLYQFLENFFDKTSPDIVFCYAVAGAPAYAMGEICERRRIPFLQLQPTRLGARYAVDSDRRGTLRRAAAKYGAYNSVSENSKAQAAKFLETFRAKPELPEYMVANQKRSDDKNTYGRAFSLMRGAALRYLVAWPKGDLEKIEKSRRAAFEAMTILRRKVAGKREQGVTTELPDRFLYYPLHVSPEASTMVLAPEQTEQIAVVEAISKSLPAGIPLVVKEHWPMLGMRPKGFYNFIERMPGVLRIQAYLPGLALVQKADLVIVISGTAAWEAFLLGRPSLSLSEMQFHCVENSGLVLNNLKDLERSIPKARTMRGADDEKILRYLSALFETSFELPSHLLWDDYTAAASEEKSAVCAEIASHMNSCLSELQFAKCPSV